MVYYQTEKLGEKFFKLQQNAHIVHKEIKSSPRFGDLAFIRDEINPTLHIVLESGQFVVLTDVCRDDEKRFYPSESVAAIKFPSI